MNLATRGVRNAFRNPIRTLSVVMILGIALGLSLVMLVANRAVEFKIQETLTSIGTTIVISPAGFSSGAAVSTALKQSDTNKIEHVPHIKKFTATLSSQLQTEGTTNSATTSPGANAGSNSQSEAFYTSLKSPVSFDCTDGVCSGGSASFRTNGGVSGPRLLDNFSIPINVVGTSAFTDPAIINASKLTLASGQTPRPGQDETMISQSMADKNKLAVGSNFQAFGAKLRVSGVFTSDTRMGDATLIMPLDTLQRLSLQKNIVTQVILVVDSLENLESATATLKKQLGTSADVSSKLDEAKNAIDPLRSVKQISLFGLIGSTVAAALTLALVMIMIVRERKREIGVLKAVGFGSSRITAQFVAEALTLTLIAFAVGATLGLIASRPIATALVSGANNNQSATNVHVYDGAPTYDTHDIQFAVSIETVLVSLSVAVVIAVISSAAATILITKIKPAEVLRGE